jgi:hypothetical protein
MRTKSHTMVASFVATKVGIVTDQGMETCFAGNTESSAIR